MTPQECKAIKELIAVSAEMGRVQGGNAQVRILATFLEKAIIKLSEDPNFIEPVAIQGHYAAKKADASKSSNVVVAQVAIQGIAEEIARMFQTMVQESDKAQARLEGRMEGLRAMHVSLFPEAAQLHHDESGQGGTIKVHEPGPQPDQAPQE